MTEDLSDSRLFLGQTMERSEICALASGTVAVFSRASPAGADRVNQDAAALIPCGAEAIVLAVADGVGGQPSGEQASGRAVRALARAVRDAAARGDPPRVGILDGFDRANAAVAELANGAATTMTVVALEGSEIRTFHAGDSPALAVGQRGRVKLHSVAHSPVGYAVAAGYLDENEALHHDDRHLILNAVGSATMHVEVGSTCSLAPRDTLLIGSDGLFDNLYLIEIVETIRKGPLPEAAATLASRCLGRMQHPIEGRPSKADDLTFMVYRRRRSPRRPASP